MIEEFLRLEASGGIILFSAAVAALLLANSPLQGTYDGLLATPVAVQVGELEIAKPLLLWVNDGLMAVFFFLIGLEIKREFLEGELSSLSKMALPGFGAIGGMLVPALVYVAINHDTPANLDGWAIPAATDIAFALGVLALLGSRVPIGLKIMLTAIAIFDDLGAIIIIAVFYTEQLSVTSLLLAAVFITALVVVNLAGVRRIAPYILIGAALWVCVLKSGVHATLAGVVTGLAIPLKPAGPDGASPLKHLEHLLHPWVAFMILPAFAFANAGVSLAGIGFANFVEPVKLGISLGLFAGKQIGIMAFLWLCIALRIATMPDGTNWAQLYGVSLLCGIGFTMSLFIGSLAFGHAEYDTPVRLGVFTGSILSALVGYLVIRMSTRPQTAA